MEKRSICILRFNMESGSFRAFSSRVFQLDIVPRIGEKIVFSENEESIITEVLDIHYSVDGNVDVFIGKDQPYIQYKADLNKDYLDTLDNNTSR